MVVRPSRKNEKKLLSCHVENTISVIGGRWKVLIIYFLIEQPRRFGELGRLLPGVSPRTLTRQLRELEEHGIIIRHDYQEIPPRVDYQLSPLGMELGPVLNAMHAWGEKYRVEFPDAEHDSKMG